MIVPSRSVLASLAFSAMLLPSLEGRGIGIRGGTHLAMEAAAAANSAPEAPDSSTSLPPANRDWESSLPHSAEVDARLTKADTHFNTGRQLYFQNNLVGAKREFDSAVEVLLSAPDGLPDASRLERRLNEVCELVYRFDVEKLGSGQAKIDAPESFDKAPIDDEIGHTTFPVDAKLASRLAAELNQTSSAIPLELADPVLNYVHFFQTERGRNILLAGFRRSGRYQALIQRVFSEEGVPQELIYLAQAESGFLPRAVSYKKAVGMWQFIAATGSRYNLNRSIEFDDRLDPEKATRAAARYLKDLYVRYNDWYLAMAAYNCGEGAVDRAVERTGYADYWELLKRRALPKETAGYVPIILAMTIMAKNPGDYGLEQIDVDPASEWDTIHLSASTNLNLIADATLQPVSVLRELNPALLRTIAPAGFDVHLPKGSADTVQAAIETVPAANRQAWRIHHVASGDTLAEIARSYHVTAEQIASVNQASDSIETGEVLLIPAVYHEERSVKSSSKHSSRSSVATARTRNGSLGHSTHVATSRRVSPQVLHRHAAVRTASLQLP